MSLEGVIGCVGLIVMSDLNFFQNYFSDCLDNSFLVHKSVTLSIFNFPNRVSMVPNYDCLELLITTTRNYSFRGGKKSVSKGIFLDGKAADLINSAENDFYSVKEKSYLKIWFFAKDTKVHL